MRGQLQHTLGRNLRAWRLEHGLTQETLGQLWGWSTSYIGTLEGGQRNASVQTVEYLAGLMGVEPLALLS